MIPRPMTVLLGSYFPRSLELEGAGSLVRGLTRGLVDRGWQVRLLLPCGEYKATDGIEIHTFLPGLAGGLRRYHKAIAELSVGCDAVLLIENNPNLVFSASASRQKVNTFSFFCTPLQTSRLLTEMGLGRQTMTHWLTKNRLFARMQNWIGRRCIVSSQFQARQLQDLGVLETHVLPVCGISREQTMPSRSQARQSLGWDNTPVVGYLGHYSRAKGVETLVEAFSLYKGPAKLGLAYSGKGALSSQATKTLEALTAAGRVRQLGVVDPPAFLAACDVVALPYITSSVFHQPQVLVESFAASTPVITTSLGGLDELVRPAQTGTLVKTRDAGALAGAIETMTADLKRTYEMGQRCREKFQRELCVESFVDRLTELLR